MFSSRETIERLHGIAMNFNGATRSRVMGDRYSRLAGTSGYDFKQFVEYDHHKHRPRHIAFARSFLRPDEKLIAREMEEPRETSVFNLVNVSGMQFASHARAKADEAACAAGFMIASSAETHDPAGLILCSNQRFFTEIRPAPLREVLEPTIEEIFEASRVAAEEPEQPGYRGLEDAIQHLPINPSIVILIMSVQRPGPKRRTASRSEPSDQERVWQVLGSIADSGHDLRCLLIVDPVEEKLPGKGEFTLSFADGTDLVTTPKVRQDWSKNFADCLARQVRFMSERGVPYAIMRTSDTDEQTLNAILEISQGF